MRVTVWRHKDDRGVRVKVFFWERERASLNHNNHHDRDEATWTRFSPLLSSSLPRERASGSKDRPRAREHHQVITSLARRDNNRRSWHQRETRIKKIIIIFFILLIIRVELISGCFGGEWGWGWWRGGESTGRGARPDHRCQLIYWLNHELKSIHHRSEEKKTGTGIWSSGKDNRDTRGARHRRFQPFNTFIHQLNNKNLREARERATGSTGAPGGLPWTPEPDRSLNGEPGTSATVSQTLFICS